MFTVLLLVCTQGCGKPAPTQQRMVHAESEYINCIGVLTGFDDQHEFCERQGDAIASGIAYCAMFRISTPTNYLGRTVGIFTAMDIPTASHFLSNTGRTFSFEIPADTLSGDETNINSNRIKNLRIIP